MVFPLALLPYITCVLLTLLPSRLCIALVFVINFCAVPKQVSAPIHPSCLALHLLGVSLMAKGPCASCSGFYQGNGRCSNRNCPKPRGPGHEKHPWNRRFKKRPSPEPDPAPKRRPRCPDPAPLCVICLDLPPQVRLLPCRHAVLCRRDAGILLATVDEANRVFPACPVCRIGFNGLIPFYPGNPD